MHPIEDIRGSKSARLLGKRIVLGITGSIAAVECVKLARELARHGADVIPVMSAASIGIVHPDSIHFATGHFPILKLDGDVKHVELCGNSSSRADLLLVAPATANTISKMAMGIDDTVVTTMASCALGSGMPVIVVPAMHSSMYDHGIVTENIRRLQRVGVTFVGPVLEESKAKMASLDDILNAVFRTLGSGDMAKKKILVIAGATREKIDDVRFLSNRSTGKMGFEVASAAARAGHGAILVSGPVSRPDPPGATVLRVETALEMHRAVMERLDGADVLVMSAAVADYRPESRVEGKRKKDGDAWVLRLVRNPDILLEAGKTKGRRIHVGFAVESRDLLENARAKLRAKNLDLIVANDPSAFGADRSTVHFLAPGTGPETFENLPKSEIAGRIVSFCERLHRDAGGS